MSISTQYTVFLPAARLMYHSFPQIPATLFEACHSLTSCFLCSYKNTGDELFLHAALACVQAYIELIPDTPQSISPKHAALLHSLCELHQCTPEELLHCVVPKPPRMAPTANRLASILGRWPASPYNSHKKGEAIQDILARIRGHQIGCTSYQASSRKETPIKKFQLVIDEKQAILYNCLEYKNYLFSEYDTQPMPDYTKDST